MTGEAGQIANVVDLPSIPSITLAALVHRGHSVNVVKPHLGMKVEQTVLDRLDSLAAAMAAAAGLGEVNRSATAIACLLAGLDALETRHGLAASAAKKGAKTASKPAK